MCIALFSPAVQLFIKFPPRVFALGRVQREELWSRLDTDYMWAQLVGASLNRKRRGKVIKCMSKFGELLMRNCQELFNRG